QAEICRSAQRRFRGYVGELSFPQRTKPTHQLIEAAASETFGRLFVSPGFPLDSAMGAMPSTLFQTSRSVAVRSCFSRGPENLGTELSKSRLTDCQEDNAIINSRHENEGWNAKMEFASRLPDTPSTMFHPQLH